jgi:hypothetical protein
MQLCLLLPQRSDPIAMSPHLVNEGPFSPTLMFYLTRRRRSQSHFRQPEFTTIARNCPAFAASLEQTLLTTLIRSCSSTAVYAYCMTATILSRDMRPLPTLK